MIDNFLPKTLGELNQVISQQGEQKLPPGIKINKLKKKMVPRTKKQRKLSKYKLTR